MSEMIKIVMIDDDNGACQMVKKTLESTGGYQVIFTTDPKQSEEICVQNNPNLIILDNVMPGRKGSEIVKNLRNLPEIKDVPIVMVSGKGEMVYLEKKHQFHWEPNNPAAKSRGEIVDSKNPEVLSQAYGVDDYVSKPFSIEVLIEVIREALERKKNRKVKSQEDEMSF